MPESLTIANLEASVIANFGAAAAIQTDDGQVLRATPLKKLPLIVAGDRVICKGDSQTDLRIVELCPRDSVLGRPDRKGHLKPLAANLTQLVIVCAVQPAPEPLLIDQFCTVAEQSDIEPIIALNKSDLITDDSRADLEQLLSVYTAAGYQTAMINTRTEAGLSTLSNLFKDHCSVLVGQSGVGKSSIVKCLLPDLDIRVGAISQATGIGSHTTTVSFRYSLDQGGTLIDSPGVRQFEVGYLSPGQIANGYREIANLAHQCRFSDCQHRVEPDCAVLKAVETDQVSALRYRNYLKLTDNSSG